MCVIIILFYIYLFGLLDVFIYFIFWIIYFVIFLLGVEKVGCDIVDCGRGGVLFLDGVLIGVEVVIGSFFGMWLVVDCCGVILDRRGLVICLFVLLLEWGILDLFFRKFINNFENDWK